MSVTATCLGFPRIGVRRELKKALESYWSGKSTADDLRGAARELRRRHFTIMKGLGIQAVPCNDFSLYDHVLDTAVTVGAVPERYRVVSDPLERYFAMARGLQAPDRRIDLPAMEMTKWFDTNYHYIVPELEPDQAFHLDASSIVRSVEEARGLGIEPRPVIVGPCTFLMLSKLRESAPSRRRAIDLLPSLLPVYEELFVELSRQKVPWVQLDEPCLVLDLDDGVKRAYGEALGRIAASTARPRVLVASYFGEMRDNASLVLQSGLDAVHVDLSRDPGALPALLKGLPPTMSLSLGLVDGRNVWRTELDPAHQSVRRAVKALGPDRVFVSSSCSLLHVPVDLAAEDRLDAELRSWMAFAVQKLEEIRALADQGESDDPRSALFDEARRAFETRRSSARTTNPNVRARLASVGADWVRRTSPFARRSKEQQARLNLPPFPTTTIGSFPQTSEVRAARAAWRAGRITAEAYDGFLEEETRRCVEVQESLGLDVLVHGEFERNDMVEYFGEKLDGFAFTENGWVQSYGSRCVKPPVLYGDVSRPSPMTVSWSVFAQSLTKRPMKGMLTGPVTILQWSFVRDDQPRAETCRQIALALRDEVADLEAAGIAMIQVDEPAIREGFPLRKGDQKAYLRWAVDAFRLATSGVNDSTQIHTHMCYSEFGEALEAIVDMDADVLSIETSRSKTELLSDFARVHYPNDIGPGVYDIHSPRVPTSEEMVDLLERAIRVVPARQLWVNPDCGLKTRGWAEVKASLANMVEAARSVRKRHAAAR